MQINFIGIFSNLSRIYEIDIVGSHTISIYYPQFIDEKDRSLPIDDVKAVCDFFEIKPVKEGEIQAQLFRPTFDDVVHSNRGESLKDLKKRIEAAKERKSVAPDLDDVSIKLINAPYNRGALSITSIHHVIGIAQTIARLDGRDKIRVEHVAEAVQYKMADKTYQVYTP